ENAPKNQKPHPSEILKDGVDKYIKKEEAKETPDMYKVDKNKIVDTSASEGPFARQRASEDGDFGVTFGAYVDDDEDMEVDLNQVTNSGATMFPEKDRSTLLNEIKQKTDRTYAESKLANL